MPSLDTNQELNCEHCNRPIWPEDEKVIVGLGNKSFAFHKECDQTLMAYFVPEETP